MNKSLKKALIIVGIVIAIIVIGAALLPRILYHVTYMQGGGNYIPATMITDYSVKFKDAVTVENDVYSVQIPSDFEFSKKTESVSAVVYANSAIGAQIVLTDTSDESINDRTTWIESPSVEAAIEKVGNGKPDSFYAFNKCVALLDGEQYSVFQLQKQKGYALLATLRATTYKDDPIYIYEREKVNAIIYGTDRMYIDVFPADSLNEPYIIICNNLSLSDVVKLLNSLEFKESRSENS